MKSSPDPPLQTTIWPIFCTSTLDVIFLVIYLERLRDFTFLAHVHYLLTIYLPWSDLVKSGKALSHVELLTYPMDLRAYPWL